MPKVNVMEKKKALLIIMDGWGEGDKSKADVIANANIPFIKSLYKTAAVLPVPVWAQPIRSVPLNTIGMASCCMGVGVT